MLVCCNKEMKVEKNGIGVEMGSEVYPGDRYVCLVCHRTVILTWEGEGLADGGAIVDPQHEMFSEYVILNQGH